MNNNYRASFVYAAVVFAALIVGGVVLHWTVGSTLITAAIGFSSALLTSMWHLRSRSRANEAPHSTSSPRP